MGVGGGRLELGVARKSLTVQGQKPPCSCPQEPLVAPGLCLAPAGWGSFVSGGQRPGHPPLED